MSSSVLDSAGHVILAFQILFPSTFIFGYNSNKIDA